MPGLSEEESGRIHTTAAIAERNARDIQQLFALNSRLSTELGRIKAVSDSNAILLQDLTDDKQSVFKWAVGMLAVFVLIGSSAALGLRDFVE